MPGLPSPFPSPFPFPFLAPSRGLWFARVLLTRCRDCDTIEADSDRETGTGSEHRERGLAAMADRKAREREALERLRRRLSWKAGSELARRFNVDPTSIETRDLAKLVTLDIADRPKTLQIEGNPLRPLIIGLEPAGDSLDRAHALAAPEPPALPPPSLTDARGQLRPMRLDLSTGTATPVNPDAP